ncbi:porin [Chthonobacter rhizosphaerae]|uniref:porin n=1 Tax=Chthonobacter rhizosphaerae TaxID=2735553 RepID=UPI0015EE66EF|nr:porin [Chthonobacter rhizosphaerae]
MTIRAFLLGTAAGLMAVTGAQAADLPGEAVPSAVDYVKVCDTFGAGFFYIPGTETCLDISGRVRFRVTANFDAETVQFRADGRVDFDARTATEYGQLRSFFRLGAGDDRETNVENAFIQLGYLTVGLAGDLYNADILYGINDFAQGGFDDTLQITVLADDLGGGFYAGASLVTQTDEDTRVTATDFEDDLEIQAAVGIAGQPWGGVDLSVFYAPETADDQWGAKLTGDLTLAEGFDARLSAAYVDAGATEAFILGAAGAFSISDAATIYAGVRYDIEDDSDDDLGANIGVDYTVVSGLVLTGEVSYSDSDEDGDDEEIQAILQLSRTW